MTLRWVDNDQTLRVWRSQAELHDRPDLSTAPAVRGRSHFVGTLWRSGDRELRVTHMTAGALGTSAKGLIAGRLKIDGEFDRADTCGSAGEGSGGDSE